MKNSIFLLVILSIFSCSKEDIIDDVGLVDDISLEPIEYVYTSYLNHKYSVNSSLNKIPDLFLNSKDVIFDTPMDIVVLDYNNDGYFDLVHTNSDYQSSFAGVKVRNYVEFYLGDKFGNLKLDMVNSNKYLGLIHATRGITLDLDEDGDLDIFFSGTGLEWSQWMGEDVPPNRFEYPLLFINNGDGTFKEHRLESVFGYWHSVTSGDIDGDGDGEILLISPEYESESYIIDYNLNPVLEIIPISEEKRFGRWSQELIDLNNDGYDDLVLASESRLSNMDSFVWMNSPGGFEDIIYIPKNEYETVVDINFLDLDNDGDLDIILNRTKDYQKAYIQIIRNDINSMVDVSDFYIDNNFNFPGGSIEKSYIGDNDNDGIIEMRTFRNGDIIFEWEYINNKFILK